MGEIIEIFTYLKEVPTFITAAMGVLAVVITLWLRVKDADIQAVTSLSKVQNEKLLALMNQNNSLLESIASLQSQVQLLHNQMNVEAEEHRKKLDSTYKSIDEMRIRVTELEDLVRVYQNRLLNTIK